MKLLGLLVVLLSSTTTTVLAQTRLPPDVIPVSLDNPCIVTLCSADTPICIKQKDGSAACINDPCIGFACPDDGSICRANTNTGEAECIGGLVVVERPLNPITLPGPITILPPPVGTTCATILCAPDTPRCIETKEGPQCVREDCETKLCKAGQVCIEQPVLCKTPPCADLLAQCVPDPCLTAKCGSDTTCTVDGQGLASCTPKFPDCATKECARGEVCFLKDVVCVQAPCPPIPTCIEDPCSDFRCTKDSKCEVNPKTGEAECIKLQDPITIFPPVGTTCATILCAPDTPRCIETKEGPQCVREDCETKLCKNGQVCIEQPIVCVTAPCPDFSTQCIPDPCLTAKCDGTCTVDNQGTAICTPTFPDCETKECAKGEVCFLKDVVCVQAPCPPIPTCIEDPCSNFGCTRDKMCQVNPKTGEPECIKLPTPITIFPPVGTTCATILCAPDTPRCIETKEGPQCVREDCETKLCKNGQVCIEQPIVCVTAPCPDFSTQCIPDPCLTAKCDGKCTVDNQGTAICTPTFPDCETKECAKGEVCFLKDVVCVQAPCPPIPTCIENPCATKICKADSTCQVNEQSGEAECIPLTPPTLTCDNFDCPEGAFRCIESPLGPKCVPYDACARKICTADSTCQINEETGVAECIKITPPPISCANVDCTVGAPNCIETPRGPTCVADGCKNTECKEGDICIEEAVVCKKEPCPTIPTCIDNPCKLSKCSLGFSCEVDNSGNANCVGNPNICDGVVCPNRSDVCKALQRPCKALFCPYEAICGPDDCESKKCKDDQKCIEKEVLCIDPVSCPTFPTCVPAVPDNPCSFTKCSLGFTCQVNNAGDANCVGDPNICKTFACPNRGDVCTAVQKPCRALFCPYEPICKPLDLCATVRCGSGYTCENGHCIRGPIQVTGDSIRPWWNMVKKNFVGKRLKKCNRRGIDVPRDASKCSRKAKTCFFGNQACEEVGPFPTARCYCDGKNGNQTWVCDRALSCPGSDEDEIQ